MENRILVSACLAGIPCRYDGKDNTDMELAELAARGMAVCVCPECMGGLAFRRIPSEIRGEGGGKAVLEGRARVVNKAGEDVSEAYICGAKETLRIAKETGIKKAILKARSPSCGAGQIYDGSFQGQLIDGDGVTAALLKEHGISVEKR